MKEQNNILPLIFIVSCLYTSLSFIAFANSFNATQQLYEAPDWVNIARLINGVLALLCLFFVFIVERKILTQSPEKLIKQGSTPKLMALLCGVFFYAPVCLSFFFFIFGASVIDVYIYSALSFIALLAWTWRYRHFLLTTLVDAKHKHITDNIPKSKSSRVNTNTMVRPYTLMLGLLGLISFLLLAIKIKWLIYPPEDYLAQNQMAILIIPLLLFFSLSCWITTILRTKKSPLASFATRATSWMLIAWFPFGTAIFFYWIGKVQKRENMA